METLSAPISEGAITNVKAVSGRARNGLPPERQEQHRTCGLNGSQPNDGALDGTNSTRHLYCWPANASMSKEKPNDDPRRQTDWKSTKQTDQPWKGPVEKEQRSDDKIDLEKWHDTNTH